MTICAQDMAVCEQYVMGMLTNVDTGLALDRIHNMLKMFMVDPPYNRSQVRQPAASQLGYMLKMFMVDPPYKRSQV